MTDGSEVGRPGVGGFSPCPGCEKIGFTIQVWSGERKPENQHMQCGNDDCRVEEYKQIHE